ncbi:MAG: helix-turn-helix transcriptional regulator, partial [Treponema sp.]|nr:helix-turn-helix transcriptional regulator [Treponema sp.]
ASGEGKPRGDYVKRMQSCKNSRRYSKPISRCIDYIYDNLHCKIQMEDLSHEAGLSKTYLSKLFHKETGKTVAQYIMEKKLDAAKNLLMFTEHSSLEIANYLNFSSESHFISVFKKSTGLTPKKFKQYNFRQTLRD